MRRPVDDEPEPIDAEFEPADGTEPKRKRRIGPRPMRSRSVSLTQLLIAMSLSTVVGSTVAIIVSNASSGAPTGTLAREIDGLVRAQGDLTARAEQTAIDVVSLRSRLDAQGERLDQQDAVELALRDDLTALASQLSAVSGVGDGQAPLDASAAKTPLGVLLGRINRLESIVAEDSTAPQTTREVQRAIAELSSQVAALDLANTTLVEAFDRREAALAALETGMQAVASGLTPKGAVPVGQAVAAAAPPPILAATARSQAIRALSALEAAAKTDQPFLKEHGALAGLLPDEAELISMAGAATTGLPTLAQLRTDFDAASNRALRIATDESDDGWNWLRTSFTGLVDFAPSDLVASNAEIVRNARRQLELGNVRGAVEATTSITGRAADAFRNWRNQALSRAALDEELRSLNGRLLGTALTTNTGG
jgi:hypothetical protein